MKKIVFVSLVTLCFFVVPYALAGTLNGVDDGQPEANPQAFTCWVENENGITVPVGGDIYVSDPWTNQITGYWIVSSGTSWTSYQPIVLIYNSDLPTVLELSALTRSTSYSGMTSTPFAITDWGSTASYGNLLVIIKANSATTYCGPYKLKT